MVVPAESKYDVFRVKLPIASKKTRSLFKEDVSDEELRRMTLREAIEEGRRQPGQWVAGDIRDLEPGVWFKVGHRTEWTNYEYADGSFLPRDMSGTVVADVILDIEDGYMLIRRDKTGPSPFLVAQAFRAWLTTVNERLETGFHPLVQGVPHFESFIEQLKAAKIIERVTFVVHGPNPADDMDIVSQISNFTQEHNITTTTVTIQSPSIPVDTAVEIAETSATKGNAVSATITDSDNKQRPIRTRKTARRLLGPASLDSQVALQLILAIRRKLNRVEADKIDGKG